MPLWTNLKKNPNFYFYSMVKLVALVFYEKKMIFLTFIHRSKNTLTAVNLQKLIEMRSEWFVSYFDWRKIKLLHFAVTHLHGILSLDCIRRNICGEMLESFLSWSLFNVERVSLIRRQFQLYSLNYPPFPSRLSVSSVQITLQRQTDT